MLDYYYNFDYKNGCLQIKKDYVIQLERLYNQILLSKNNKIINLDKSETDNDLNHFINGRITPDLINYQLANIRHVGFEVTDACNLKCTYCTYGDLYNDYDERSNKQIDPQKAIVLLDFLIEKSHSQENHSPVNEILISFYGGEPLLNIDFIQQIINYTQQKQDCVTKFNYGITTNAIYLKKHLSFLRQYNFLVTVSLDGSKQNNAYRKFSNKKPSFEIVYNNLKYIQNNYSDFFDNNIRFNAVLHSLNNTQEVFDFFQHEFNKTPRFSEITPAGVNPSRIKEYENIKQHKPIIKNESLLEKMKDILDLNFEDNKLLQDFIFQYSGNVYTHYNDLLADKKKEFTLPTATCIPFSRRIFMTVNNKILPCERIGQQYALGKVTNDSVMINCQSIAEKYNAFYNSLQNQCKNCFWINNCTQCMFNITNLGCKGCVCNKKSDEQTFDKYLNANMKTLSDNPVLYKRIMNEVIINK